MDLTKENVLEVLKLVMDPELDRDIVTLGMVKEVHIQDTNVKVVLEVTAPSPKVGEAIREEVQKRLTSELGSADVSVELRNLKNNEKMGAPTQMPLPGIKNIIVVASGKGGVGKSTTTVNLALALKESGAKVGVMDGDIYGPNIPLMLGVSNEKPAVSPDQKMIPVDAFGLKVISMAFLVDPNEPMIWRGPMLHGAITQFLQKVEWGELDYLVIDLPPGTGDVQLSLVQTVALSGAVIVTTPQEVALSDVRKGIAAFGKTNVSILGIVENMTGEIFGSGGGKSAADHFNVPYLGEVPLDAAIRVGGDSGKPIFVENPSSEASAAYRNIAEHIAGVTSQV